jgi:hypothetical protein
VHPVLPRSDERESEAARARFFEKDPVLFEKHPKRYPDLFVAEGNYLKIDGFWEAFHHGVERYRARIDISALIDDARVRRDSIPEWMRRQANA